MGSATDQGLRDGHEVIADGEWAGWVSYPGEPFEDHAGPFFYRLGEDGAPVCAMRVEARHLNSFGGVHGGALMAFADYALFIIARDALRERTAVTAGFDAAFLGAATAGALIECRGDVLRNGRSLVAVRGVMTAAGEPVMSFSGLLKKTSYR
ncbi:PaaI family thioesterase [Phenylobacterium sp.]|jgi:uncharacterized protein (TIGR00369 family)|uniref:PaaI family thioesterase n=1 Tax=Phenylobacterium sp. TaxID=1871053 RepID=UPI0037851F49